MSQDVMLEEGGRGMNKIILAVTGGASALVAYITSWNPHIGTLLILMGIDFAFGLLTPIFVGRSKKDATGKISSKICRRGIIKKCVVFMLIYVSWLLSKEAGIPMIVDAVTMAFIISETISILENSAILGVPIPKVLLKVLKIMNEKASAGIDLLAHGEVVKNDSEKLTLETVKKEIVDNSSKEDKNEYSTRN